MTDRRQVLLQMTTALDDLVSEIRTAVHGEAAESRGAASWNDLMADEATRRATLAHWSTQLQASFAFLTDQFRNVVVVGDASRARCALLLNVLLAEPALFDDDVDENHAKEEEGDQEGPSLWSGVVKIVHGHTRQFRVVPVDATAASAELKWHGWEDSEGRNALRSLLRDARGTARGFAVELRAPSQRPGVALFDCSRLGEHCPGSLVAQYVRNADCVVWATRLDWAPPTPREAALLDLVAAEPGAKCFAAADFEFAKQTFTFDRFVGTLRQRWPTLFGAAAADADTVLHHFPFALTEQAVLKTRLLELAKTATAAASAASAAPLSDAETAAVLAREGFVENVRHFLASSDDRRATALVARRLITLSHEISLFAALALNQGQSVRKRDVLRRETSLQGIDAALAMTRQLLDSTRDATAATISDAFVQHCDVFFERFLAARHSASSLYGAITADFRAHVLVFGAEFEELCRAHAEALRRAVLDTLAACEAHGAPPCDVDVDWLARSICRRQQVRGEPRGYDADGIALVDFVGEPLMAGADDGLYVPVVSTLVASLVSFVHDARVEWRAAATQWRDAARARLVSSFLATAERRHDACHAALARVLELARVQLRVKSLDLELMKDTSAQARDIAQRLQTAVTRSRTLREELEQLLELVLPLPRQPSRSAPPSPARAAPSTPVAAPRAAPSLMDEALPELAAETPQ